MRARIDGIGRERGGGPQLELDVVNVHDGVAVQSVQVHDELARRRRIDPPGLDVQRRAHAVPDVVLERSASAPGCRVGDPIVVPPGAGHVLPQQIDVRYVRPPARFHGGGSSVGLGQAKAVREQIRLVRDRAAEIDPDGRAVKPRRAAGDAKELIPVERIGLHGEGGRIPAPRVVRPALEIFVEQAGGARSVPRRRRGNVRRVVLDRSRPYDVGESHPTGTALVHAPHVQPSSRYHDGLLGNVAPHTLGAPRRILALRNEHDVIRPGQYEFHALVGRAGHRPVGCIDAQFALHEHVGGCDGD
mmetsp:Transcript_22098/g.65498  ORF Transcript_22098/g.65498 Transcript_22098/m.65498 type:complete len:302 (-) Transcript_22098:458-1363(-)